MRKRAGLAWVAVLAAGCSSPGVLVDRQEPDKPARVDRVPVDGQYGLFIAGQDQPLPPSPFQLKQGDPLGFDRSDVGRLTFVNAVFGRHRLRLQVDQTYEWRRL